MFGCFCNTVKVGLAKFSMICESHFVKKLWLSCQTSLIKDGVDGAPDDPGLAVGAEHGVRLAGRRLAVGEDG